MVLARGILRGALGVALLIILPVMLVAALTIRLTNKRAGAQVEPLPDPALAPMCPQCGLQMIFVQYSGEAEEYRCKVEAHGRYGLDREGLFPLSNRSVWRRKSN